MDPIPNGDICLVMYVLNLRYNLIGNPTALALSPSPRHTYIGLSLQFQENFP